ncbi:MAG: isoprenylcysteine carboxylmethyltransferase family protein [Planctomycetota bacterium]
MKSASLTASSTPTPSWQRWITVGYGAAVYLTSVAALLYTIAFSLDLWVPRTVSTGPARPVGQAVLGNLALLMLFGLQHSVMARPAFKRALGRWVPGPAERPTYCLATCICLGLLFALWSPIEGTVWITSAPWLVITLRTIAGCGFVLLLTASFQLNHFELFGLQQPWRALHGRPQAATSFQTPRLYRLVRHPIYLGMLMIIWAAPHLTVGHLLFSSVCTAYILVGSTLEEIDLVASLGAPYRNYQRRVSRLIPLRAILGSRRS